VVSLGEWQMNRDYHSFFRITFSLSSFLSALPSLARGGSLTWNTIWSKVLFSLSGSPSVVSLPSSHSTSRPVSPRTSFRMCRRFSTMSSVTAVSLKFSISYFRTIS